MGIEFWHLGARTAPAFWPDDIRKSWPPNTGYAISRALSQLQYSNTPISHICQQHNAKRILQPRIVSIDESAVENHPFSVGYSAHYPPSTILRWHHHTHWTSPRALQIRKGLRDLCVSCASIDQSTIPCSVDRKSIGAGAEEGSPRTESGNQFEYYTQSWCITPRKPPTSGVGFRRVVTIHLGRLGRSILWDAHQPFA